jgi:myo-inositol-1(or 4)-monophosphatase
VRLHPSTKIDLKAALVGTGQAKPGEDLETYRRIGQSVTAMLNAVRSGLLAGALLVEAAGGTLTDTHGQPWSLTSDDFLATAPGLHTAAVAALAAIV